MSRVTLTDYLTNLIVNNVDSIIRQNKGTLPRFPDQAPVGVGDEIFSQIMPLSHEKEIRLLAPDWYFSLNEGTYVQIDFKNYVDPNILGKVYSCTSTAWAKYDEAHIATNGRSTIRNIPGIEELKWSGGASITPTHDFSAIQLPELRKFVEDMYAVWKTGIDVEVEVHKATTDMRNFLGQFRTLNKAAEKFGPAIWEFVPAEFRKLHDALSEKREPRPKKEELPSIDMDYLIARATEHRLQLN